MGVYNPLEPGTPAYPYRLSRETCHKCSKPLNTGRPAVIWILDGLDLNLHPDCAKELALHLGKDGIDAGHIAAYLDRNDF